MIKLDEITPGPPSDLMANDPKAISHGTPATLGPARDPGPGAGDQQNTEQQGHDRATEDQHGQRWGPQQDSQVVQVLSDEDDDQEPGASHPGHDPECARSSKIAHPAATISAESLVRVSRPPHPEPDA